MHDHAVFHAEAPTNRSRPERPRFDWASIRAYQPADREVVRRICCVTAFRSAGARAILGDEHLCADYFSLYYTDIEPDLSYVAELDGRVVGYVFGCRDARLYAATMAHRIVPRLLARAVGHLARGRYRDSALRRYLRWAFTWSWRETLSVPLADYPGHYHINVLPEGQNQELYSRLSLTYLNGFEAKGGSGIHGLLTERQKGGAFSRFVNHYSAAYPDARVVRFERPTRFGRDVLGIGVPMVNRAFCFTNTEFGRLMRWVSQRYGG
jgi:hypothetical protein